MKKSIHFILPSGGVRGSFQAGFLFELFTYYRDSFTIYRVDGTSVGSLNGIALICDRIDLLKKIWFEIENINDFFSNWSNIPIIGKIKSLYEGFYNNGLYNSDTLKNKLIKNLEETISNMPSETLKKFSCCAMNVTQCKSEFVLGDNKNIIDYVIASASPWILCNPKKINENLYTDGAVLDAYPIQFVDSSDADLKIIVGFDQESLELKQENTTNLLFFLARLLDITKLHSYNTIKLKQLIKDNICIPITNTMGNSMINFNKKTIREGFEQGQKMAHLFYKTYIQENQ